MSRELLLAMVLVSLINLPFGAWREGVRRFSGAWFVAVHAPVPLVVAVRMLLSVPWGLGTVPWLVASYLAGQHLGARWRRAWTARR